MCEQLEETIVKDVPSNFRWKLAHAYTLQDFKNICSDTRFTVDDVELRLFDSTLNCVHCTDYIVYAQTMMCTLHIYIMNKHPFVSICELGRSGTNITLWWPWTTQVKIWVFKPKSNG